MDVALEVLRKEGGDGDAGGKVMKRADPGYLVGVFLGVVFFLAYMAILLLVILSLAEHCVP